MPLFVYDGSTQSKRLILGAGIGSVEGSDYLLLTVTGSPSSSLPTFLTGSIPFSSSAGTLSEDNPNLFYDSSSHTLFTKDISVSGTITFGNDHKLRWFDAQGNPRITMYINTINRLIIQSAQTGTPIGLFDFTGNIMALFNTTSTLFPANVTITGTMTIQDNAYFGDLKPNRAGVSYTGYVYVPITGSGIACVDINTGTWDGNLTRNTGTWTVNLQQASMNLPANIKAVEITVGGKSTTLGETLIARARGAGVVGTGDVIVTIQVSNIPIYNSGIVRVDSVNSDIEFNIQGSGGSTITSAYAYISGYFV